MYRSIVVMLVAVLSFFSVPEQGQAQSAPMMDSVNPALMDGLNFRLVGPGQGGRSTAVTGVPSQPGTYYMGVASGGLFRTTDYGETWVPITDGQVPLGSTGAIAVADTDPNIIYLGTGSDGVRSNVSTGRGVYKTTDGGETWSFAGLYDVGQIGGVRIHPTNPDIVWVAANGDIFKPSPDRGVYKTTDGGETWEKTLFVSDSTGAMDVEIQPGNPDVVYAWMNRIERKPWTIISGSHEGGFYKSTDGGESWEHIMNGLPQELIGKGNLAVTAAKPDRVYALVEAKPDAGFYRSDDYGESWQKMSDAQGLLGRPFYYTSLGSDPTDADVVYGGSEGWFFTRDGGVTWTRQATPHGDNHDIWVDPNDGNVMVQANDGGANVSIDGGRTWSTQMNQPTMEIYGVWTDDRFPYRLYGAQQDDGTHILSMAATGGVRGEDWWSGPGCETGPIIPHPSKPNIVYGSCKGQYSVMNMDTRQSKNYWVGAQSLYGNEPPNLVLRFQRVSPMEVSPHDPEILYYGSNKLHRTRDLGVTWETISPDLTWNPPHSQRASGWPITRDVTGEEVYSTLYAIRESLHEPGVIWTGANDGLFYITRDNGANWTNPSRFDTKTSYLPVLGHDLSRPAHRGRAYRPDVAVLSPPRGDPKMRTTLALACLMVIMASFVLTSCSGAGRYKASVYNPAHTQTTVAKKGPPPHAPAHGYRHKHGDAVLVYESSLNVYIVKGYEGHYFSDGDYYRMHKSGWQVSVDIGGPWKKISETKIPKGLHGEHHAKTKKKK